MKTIEDIVREHAKENKMSTDDGLKYLELENKPENYVAANLYLTALSIIRKLQKNWRNKMNANEIELGEIYYSTHQKKPVQVLSIKDEYVRVQDEQGNRSLVHVSTLQKWDLSADEILEREG